MIRMMWHDVRYALRQLRKSPGFTLTAIGTLAFGICATTAIFSIVEGVLLRPLPFPHQENLVLVGDQLEGTDALPAPSVSAPEIAIYQREASSFAQLGAYQTTSYELAGAGDPAMVNGSRLAANVVSMLGVTPVLGRTYTAQEDISRAPVALLSYETWRGRFQGDPAVLGKKILLDRKPYEVIGVMPRDFEFPLVPGQLNRSELWVPLSMTAAELKNQGSWSFRLAGRLKPNVTPALAQAEANGAAQDIMRTFPGPMQSLRVRPIVQRLDQATTEQARPLVRTLFLAVMVVLFIACANLAGLLLVRVLRRRREIAVRLALGASTSTILRQSLTETLTLSLAGGLIGLAFASAALRVGVRYLPETLPRVSSIGLDWKVVTFAILLAVATGLLCGLLPAFAASRTGVNEALKEGGRTGSAGAGHARLRSALVVAEVAVALVLLVASGLLLRSYEKLREVNLGFRVDHTLTATYSLPRREYPDQSTVDAFNQAILLKLQGLPSVTAVGITSQLPATDQTSSNSFVVEGYNAPKDAPMNFSWTSQVLGNYFTAAGIPLLRGRDFSDADRADSPLVVIVNRTLAQHYWPGQSPIGKRLHWGLPNMPMPWLTVVGEIGDVKQSSADAPIQEQIYQPASQMKATYGQFAQDNTLNANGGTIVIRAAVAPEQMTLALTAAVSSIDSRLPLTQVDSMERIIAQDQAPHRFNALLISGFAATAVSLALLGIYSVIAFSAALRTQEMAIRLALGSQRSSVMQMILKSGAKLGLLGCGIGGVIAVFATRILRSFLFQVDPIDPTVMALAVISIFMLAVAASVIPARRAAMIDPIDALRGE